MYDWTLPTTADDGWKRNKMFKQAGGNCLHASFSLLKRSIDLGRRAPDGLDSLGDFLIDLDIPDHRSSRRFASP